MNNNRRKEIKQIINYLHEAISKIESVKDDEEEYMENIPENMQGGDRYSMAEEACEHLEDAISDIECAIESLDDARV